MRVNPTAVYAICFAHVRRRGDAARVPALRARGDADAGHARRLLRRHLLSSGSNRILLGIITLDLFAVLLGGATALLPIFAKDVFDVGPTGLGMLRAAPAVGALLITVALTRWSFTRGVGRIEFIAVAVFGVATIVFASTGSFWLAWFALAVMGGADAISVVIRMTLLQLETPDDMRGRVSAVNSLFVSMSNQIGDFRAGAGRELHRRGAGGAGRRHRHADGRAALHPAVSRALSRRELPRHKAQMTRKCRIMLPPQRRPGMAPHSALVPVSLATGIQRATSAAT